MSHDHAKFATATHLETTKYLGLTDEWKISVCACVLPGGNRGRSLCKVGRIITQPQEPVHQDTNTSRCPLALQA